MSLLLFLLDTLKLMLLTVNLTLPRVFIKTYRYTAVVLS